MGYPELLLCYNCSIVRKRLSTTTCPRGSSSVTWAWSCKECPGSSPGSTPVWRTTQRGMGSVTRSLSTWGKIFLHLFISELRAIYLIWGRIKTESLPLGTCPGVVRTRWWCTAWQGLRQSVWAAKWWATPPRGWGTTGSSTPPGRPSRWRGPRWRWTGVGQCWSTLPGQNWTTETFSAGERTVSGYKDSPAPTTSYQQDRRTLSVTALSTIRPSPACRYPALLGLMEVLGRCSD